MDSQQKEMSSYRSNLDQPETSSSQPGPWGFASPLENLYPDRPQDVEPTFGPPDRELVSYEDLQDDQASGPEADPQEKDRLFTEDHSYRETVGAYEGCPGLHGLVIHTGPGVYCPI